MVQFARTRAIEKSFASMFPVSTDICPSSRLSISISGAGGCESPLGKGTGTEEASSIRP